MIKIYTCHCFCFRSSRKVVNEVREWSRIIKKTKKKTEKKKNYRRRLFFKGVVGSRVYINELIGDVLRATLSSCQHGYVSLEVQFILDEFYTIYDTFFFLTKRHWKCIVMYHSRSSSCTSVEEGIGVKKKANQAINCINYIYGNCINFISHSIPLYSNSHH